MVSILLVAERMESIEGLKRGLEEEGMDIHLADSASKALAMAGQISYDLAVADERIGDMTALEFAENLTRVNPMVNCAVVSPLSEEAFHEASEGLGVLCRVPVGPDAEDARRMLRRLDGVLAMTSGIGRS